METRTHSQETRRRRQVGFDWQRTESLYRELGTTVFHVTGFLGDLGLRVVRVMPC